MANAEGRKFLWWQGNAPSWLAAVGTLAVAYIAFVTLGPVIENLEIRDRNRELTTTNKELKSKITDTELALNRATTDLASVNSRVEAATSASQTAPRNG